MTVIPDKDLQSALNTALALAFPTTAIAWENTNYAPVIGTPYFRVFLLPAETDVITELNGAAPPWQRRQGIFQVSVLYPANVGFGPPKGKAAEVVAAFRAKTVLTYNTLRVVIDKSWPSSGMDDETGWYQVPVNIRYHCESNA